MATGSALLVVEEVELGLVGDGLVVDYDAF
jgi:hypothetical protein